MAQMDGGWTSHFCSYLDSNLHVRLQKRVSLPRTHAKALGKIFELKILKLL